MEDTAAETAAWAARLAADSELCAPPAARSPELPAAPGARDSTSSATSSTASFTLASVRAPASWKAVHSTRISSNSAWSASGVPGRRTAHVRQAPCRRIWGAQIQYFVARLCHTAPKTRDRKGDDICSPGPLSSKSARQRYSAAVCQAGRVPESACQYLPCQLAGQLAARSAQIPNATVFRVLQPIACVSL